MRWTIDLIIPAWCAANVNVRGGPNGCSEQSELLDCLCFGDGRSVSIIHPNKKRLAGGYVGKWEADDMGGGEGEDESQIWCKVMRLDPYQGEQAVDLSPLSHIRLLSDFFIYVPATFDQWGEKNYLALVYLQTNGAQCQWLYMTDFILDNSRRLLVWCVLLFEEFDLCLACSMCVNRLPMLVTADLPALALGN